MKRGRPTKIRFKKSYARKKYGRARRGAKNPKQLAATMGRRRVRRGKKR